MSSNNYWCRQHTKDRAQSVQHVENKTTQQNNAIQNRKQFCNCYNKPVFLNLYAWRRKKYIYWPGLSVVRNVCISVRSVPPPTRETSPVPTMARLASSDRECQPSVGSDEEPRLSTRHYCTLPPSRSVTMVLTISTANAFAG